MNRIMVKWFYFQSVDLRYWVLGCVFNGLKVFSAILVTFSFLSTYSKETFGNKDNSECWLQFSKHCTSRNWSDRAVIQIEQMIILPFLCFAMLFAEQLIISAMNKRWFNAEEEMGLQKTMLISLFLFLPSLLVLASVIYILLLFQR